MGGRLSDRRRHRAGGAASRAARAQTDRLGRAPGPFRAGGGPAHQDAGLDGTVRGPRRQAADPGRWRGRAGTAGRFA
ncbi:hypothetical protein G6F54_014551 [Rhizopus delemar]|nr:hypothetical protein G6F54_014551 [Rhizopus delemar]